jgi:hypothetical protein
MRPGGTTREKWRTPDEKVGERSIFMLRASKGGSLHLCQLRIASVGVSQT